MSGILGGEGRVIGTGQVRDAADAYTRMAKAQADEHNSCMQIRDRSPIEMAIDEIDQAIESLTYELNELGIRMSPVLRPQGNSAQNAGSTLSDQKPGIVMPSPIEERLQALSKRLRIIAAATSITRNLLTI